MASMLSSECPSSSVLEKIKLQNFIFELSLPYSIQKVNQSQLLPILFQKYISSKKFSLKLKKVNTILVS